jgi:hypothetical protein
MTISKRHPHSLCIKLSFIFSVLLTLETASAFSAGNPCEVFTPTNFETLSLEKKIKVSEVIRECERRLVQRPEGSSTKDFKPSQTETRTFEYTNALANRRVYRDMRASFQQRGKTSSSR